MSFKDTAAIAKQLAFEMNIPYGSYLDEAVETWLQGAKEERDLLKELEGCMAQTWSGVCYNRRGAAPPLPRRRYRNRTPVSDRRGYEGR